MSAGPVFTAEELAALSALESDEDGSPLAPEARRLIDLSRVHETFSRYLYLPDPTVLDVAIGTFIAHRLGGDPVWTLLVGAPSSGKTEVLRALYGLPEVHALSSLTAQTFASGLKGKAGASLLHRMDKEGRSFLVLKDFTTVLTMYREGRQEVLAQLREIYDGAFVKEFGTGETIAWEGRLGLLAGVTPVVDNTRIVSALLGERFLYLRLPQQDRVKLSQAALATRSHEREMREALKDAVHTFIGGVELNQQVVLTPATTERVVTLADLATWIRSGVERDGRFEVVAIPEPESPARFAKQMASLVAALQAIGHDEDGAAGLALRVAYDSMPPGRLRTLRVLRGVEELQTPDMVDAVGLPDTTTRRILEDLTALRLVDRKGGKGGSGGAHRWGLTDRTRSLWQVAEPEEEP